MAAIAQTPQRSGLVAAVERQLESLSPRDRKLLVGLLGFFALVLVGGLWWTLSGLLGALADDVRSANEKLGQIRALQTEYAAANEQLAAQEGRIKQYSEQPVTAWIEGLAQQAGVQSELRSVDQVSSELVGTLQQTHYKVELKKAQYDPMLDFLYALETSGYPARVEVTTIKSSTLGKDKGKAYDLTLELVAYSVGEAK